MIGYDDAKSKGWMLCCRLDQFSMAGPATNSSNRGRFGQCQWEHSAPLVHVVLLAHGSVVHCHQLDQAESCMGSINDQTGLDLVCKVRHELLVVWGFLDGETHDVHLVEMM